MASDNDNGDVPQDFGVLLAKLGDGDTSLELGDRLYEVVKALTDPRLHGVKAEGVLKLELKLKSDGQGGVDILPKIETKLPRRGQSRTVTWVDKKGHLVTANPKQQELPLRRGADVAALRPVGGKDVS